MITAVAFAVAAGVGAVLRATADVVDGDRFRIPLGTLTVNLVGSFLLGAGAGLGSPVFTVVGTAGIGALTTFSTFSGQLVELARDDRAAAIAYAAVSLTGGVSLAWIGSELAG